VNVGSRGPWYLGIISLSITPRRRLARTFYSHEREIGELEPRFLFYIEIKIAVPPDLLPPFGAKPPGLLD
jgi:hypothetical protein